MNKALLCLAAAAMTAAPALAQTEPEKTTVVQENAPTRRNPIVREGPPARLVDITFAGGTVTEYITALRQVTQPDPVNVVVGREAATQQLSEITLRRVPLDIAVRAISTAAGGDAGGYYWKIQPLQSYMTKEGEQAYSVEYVPQDQSRPASPARPRSELRVFSLQAATGATPGQKDEPGIGLTPEVVLSAIQAAVDMSRGEGEPEAILKYHRDSGVLVMTGSRETLHAAGETLAAIERDVRVRREAARASRVSAEELADLKAAYEKAGALAGQRRHVLDARQEAATRAELAAKAGMMSDGELTTVRNELAVAQGEQQIAMIDAQRATERYEAARARFIPAGQVRRVYDVSTLSDEQAAVVKTNLQKLERDVGPGRLTHRENADGRGRSLSFEVTGDPEAMAMLDKMLPEELRGDGNAQPDRGGGKGAGGRIPTTR